MIPGTSKNCPYHTDLLVFCLKFKLSPACEYLNYYYNITNDCWAIPEKSERGIEDILFFKKNPRIFEVRHFTFGNSVKLCYTPWKFQRQKPRILKMQQDFVLITPKRSTFTFRNSGQNKALLLEIL